MIAEVWREILNTILCIHYELRKLVPEVLSTVNSGEKMCIGVIQSD